MLKLIVKPMTRTWPYLENNFSSKELVDICKDISDRYAPALPASFSGDEMDFKLSKQELREISHNISLYYAPRILSSTQNLVMLPIDPQHIYVYWNLGDSQSSQPFHDMFEQQLKLKIYSHTKGKQKAEKVYEATVQGVQSGQQIKLVLDYHCSHYSAKISRYLPQLGCIGSINSNLIKTSYGNTQQTEQENQTCTKISFPSKSSYVAENIKAVKSHYAGSNSSGQRK